MMISLWRTMMTTYSSIIDLIAKPLMFNYLITISPLIYVGYQEPWYKVFGFLADLSPVGVTEIILTFGYLIEQHEMVFVEERKLSAQ